MGLVWEDGRHKQWGMHSSEEVRARCFAGCMVHYCMAAVTVFRFNSSLHIVKHVLRVGWMDTLWSTGSCCLEVMSLELADDSLEMIFKYDAG